MGPANQLERRNDITLHKRNQMIVSMGTILFVGCALSLAVIAESRVWTDIETYHPFYAYDGRFGKVANERDPFHFTLSPSRVPSRTPSISPSLEPTMTVSPSRRPSKSVVPSTTPTKMPSKSSQSPSTNPSTVPSKEPSIVEFPENDPPLFPNSSYFDYNIERDAEYGPGYPELVMHNATYMKIEYQNNGWITRTPPKNWYWSEFDANGTGPWAGVLANKNPTKNKCSGSDEQSPIDIRDNGAECFEHHEVRERRGDYTLGGGKIKTQILSNKLRLLFDRRPCPQVDQYPCNITSPPTADFPNNWGGHVDLLHVDFKIPSEHLIYGERFDAEMQLYHLHPTRRRTPTVASLMRASYTGYNMVLQQIIDRFQFLFDNHKSQCAARTRQQRRLITNIHRVLGINVTSPIDYESWGDFSVDGDLPKNKESDRRLQELPFTPHDKMLVPSIYFFGYNGSLTEPPCSEFVSWFVCDVPMQMSYGQLQQLKIIQFEYVDPFCRRTSVHYRGSNARPIQETFGRPVFRCTPKDFLADPV